MLNKYLNSPALALTVEVSAIRRRLFCLACCALALSIALVFRSGHFDAAIVMALVGSACLASLYREPLCGASLGWRDGQWLMIFRGEFMAVQLLPGAVCLPRVLRLSLLEPRSGQCFRLLLFSDSASSLALLRLRRRLLLERGVSGG